MNHSSSKTWTAALIAAGMTVTAVPATAAGLNGALQGNGSLRGIGDGRASLSLRAERPLLHGLRPDALNLNVLAVQNDRRPELPGLGNDRPLRSQTLPENLERLQDGAEQIRETNRETAERVSDALQTASGASGDRGAAADALDDGVDALVQGRRSNTDVVIDVSRQIEDINLAALRDARDTIIAARE